MRNKPAIPRLLLYPGESSIDVDAVFAIAGAYARAGLLVSHYGHTCEAPVFAFPAVVCAAFAVELYFKFFVMVGHVERGDIVADQARGHPLLKLWEKLKPEHRALIAGMHRHDGDEPLTTAPELRTEMFLKALNEIGESPFVKWRYVHELTDIGHMSHELIQEVLEALEGAARYVMRQRAGGEGGH